MRSVFSPAPFTKFDLGRHLLSDPIGDILEKFNISEEDINKLIDKIPSNVAGAYRQRLEECKAKGITSAEGATCFYNLYQDIKNESNKAPAPVVTAPPAASSFPIVPVALAGVGILALIFILTRKKK